MNCGCVLQKRSSSSGEFNADIGNSNGDERHGIHSRSARRGLCARLRSQPGSPQAPALADPHRRYRSGDELGEGAMPSAAGGLQVSAFAKGLDHPRWLYVLPNGDILVAETDAPPRPEEGKGIKTWFMSFFMKRAGSTKKPSPNRIILLRDADGDGVAEIKRTFLTGLNSPFGMALAGDAFYVADTDALLHFRYDGENVSQAGEKVADLPGGPIDHHWTKNVIASEDGKKLYVTVGSNSNVGENGLDKEKDRAAILRSMQLRARAASMPQGCAIRLGWAGSRSQAAMDRRQRARRTWQRCTPGLPHIFEGWRLLRLALQLFWSTHRRAREGAEARSRCESNRARLWARRAYGIAGACIL